MEIFIIARQNAHLTTPVAACALYKWNTKPRPKQGISVKTMLALATITIASATHFISPKPFPSWTLDEDSCLWDSPVPYPNDGKRYTWNEEILNWQEINF
jgi:hypothetical protein